MSKPNLLEVRNESKNCFITANWEARAETPDEIAARFLRVIHSLKEIDPVFSLWTCGRKRPEKLEDVRDRFAEEIAAGVTRDDWKEPIPQDGYWFGAFTRNVPKSRSFTLSCHAGSILNTLFQQPCDARDKCSISVTTGCGHRELPGLSSRSVGASGRLGPRHCGG